ncbi:glutamate dehydrogenase, partial [Salmonella enterica subsp. enterica serovar Typhimurium]
MISRHLADALTCKRVRDGSNGTSYPVSDVVLASRGILVGPDVGCYAGGVTGSYFVWVLDLACFFWSEEEI